MARHLATSGTTSCVGETAGPAGGDARGRKGPWRRWLAPFALSILIVALVCLVRVPKYATPDDFVQDLYVRGAYWGNSGILMLYSLVPFSAPVSLLYDLAPAGMWFPLVLLAMVCLGFVMAYDIVLDACPDTRLRILLLGFLAVCEALVTAYFSYTVVAFVAVGGGMARLAYRWAMSRRDRLAASDVVCLLLTIEGFSLRPESGLAAAMVFIPFLVWMLVRNRYLRGFALVLATCLLAAASYGMTRVAYDTTPGWEDFRAMYTSSRAIADYPAVDKDEAARVAPDLSSNDVDMIYEFLFVDSNVYGLSDFQALDRIVPSYGVGALVSAVTQRPAFVGYLGLMLVTLFILAALLVHSGPRGGLEAVFRMGVPLAVAVWFLIFLLRARLKMQVLLPLFVVGVMALAATCSLDRADDESAGDRRLGWLPIAACALSLLMVAGLTARTAILPVQRSLGIRLTEDTQAYVDDHAEELVVFPHSQGILINSDIFAFEGWDLPDHVVLESGYEYWTSAWAGWLDAHGYSRDGFMAYLVEGTPDGRQAVCICTEEQAERIRVYLEEHYAPSVGKEAVANLGSGTQTDGDECVWRFQARTTTTS